MSPAARLRLVLGELLFAACAGLLPAVLLGAWGLVADPAPSRSRFLVAAGAGSVAALWIWLHHLARRIRASRRRMADPMYRAKLVEFEMAAVAGREGARLRLRSPRSAGGPPGPG